VTGDEARTGGAPESVGRVPDRGVPGRSAVPLALEAIDVTRYYDQGGVRVEALRGASLAVATGDHVAIVGPSGSGKSTLMHLLGGLDRPSSGTLRIAGRDVATLHPDELAKVRNTTVGFVFQSFHLLARTTALDNVALPLVYRGVRGAERRRRAAATLDLVGLGHRLGHRPNQLSGGEQQRVAIARALVTEPQVILADEPTGTLDSQRGAEVLDLLGQLNAERGVALVIVTHDAAVAGRASREVHMRDGLIVSPDDLMASPDGRTARAGPDRATDGLRAPEGSP
jgi:putative ABC transport system ATP-binding protein